MSHKKRVTLLAFLDSIIVFSAIYATYVIIYLNEFQLNPFLMFKSGNLLLTAISLLIFHHLMAWHYKLYNQAWEQASVGELLNIVYSSTVSVLASGLVVWLLKHDVYVRALAITWMVYLILIGGSRFVWRIINENPIKDGFPLKRTLIIGAGDAGRLLVRQSQSQPTMGIEAVAFIDDDTNKKNLQLFGVTVVGDTSKIVESARKYNITQIVIAIPSLKKKDMARIYEECAKTKLKTVIMPNVEDLMLGNLSSAKFKDVDVEDLLGRDPVELDIESISKNLTGKTILVTGAGGSIGSEICRQLCKFGPSKLLLLGHGENSIYKIEMELKNNSKSISELIPIIADVQDRKRIFEVISYYRPEIIYHAAAHKHVPLMEYNPKEAVKNNVIGTKNVAEAAKEFGVERFVLVSTDKAVNPTNVMGSTKRIAEMIIQKLAKNSTTVFAAVRFGNVLGSRGSAIPLFKKQIAQGGPITVTHPDMTRYFMTIPEASRLVLQAGVLAKGGEIFVLDMGEPVKIVDLATKLIKLSGYSVEEIGIEYTGIRPGEKMYEELLNEDEVDTNAIYPKIFVGKAMLRNEEKIDQLIDEYENFNDLEAKDFVLRLANSKNTYEYVRN